MTAPYPLLRAPLPGYIMPKGSTWSGGQFGVTSTLQDHINAGRNKGTDIANYPRSTGAQVRCMRTGVIYQKYVQPYHNPAQIGDGALIIRIRSKEGNHGYAHLKAFAWGMYVGKTVTAGTVIGYVGHSGTKVNSPHLHTHWQDNAGVHREVYLQMEQSRNMQFNSTVVGVRLRTAPSLSGSIWGSVGAGGIVRKSDGKKVAERSAILIRRRVVAVYKDGYYWMPISVAATSLWTAKNFIHFV